MFFFSFNCWHDNSSQVVGLIGLLSLLFQGQIGLLVQHFALYMYRKFGAKAQTWSFFLASLSSEHKKRKHMNDIEFWHPRYYRILSALTSTVLHHRYQSCIKQSGKNAGGWYQRVDWCTVHSVLEKSTKYIVFFFFIRFILCFKGNSLLLVRNYFTGYKAA